MPKTEKLKLEEIKKLDYAKLYFRNDFSQLAHVLNNLVLSEISIDSLPFEDQTFFKDYAKLMDVFQFSIKHVHTIQNKTIDDLNEQYRKLNKKREEKNKLKKQRNEISSKVNFLKEKIEEIYQETQELKEKAQDLEYKYKCPDCLEVKFLVFSILNFFERDTILKGNYSFI